MTQTAQLGFDFPDDISPMYREQETGTWTTPRFTTEQYRDIFALTTEKMSRLWGVERKKFELGMKAAQEAHADMLTCSARSEPYALMRSPIHPDAETLVAFVKGCTNMIDGDWDSPGHDYKRRLSRHMVEIGLHHLDMGCVVVRQWDDGIIGVDYRPTRDGFFRDSYRDAMRMIRVSDDLFAGHGCVQALCEAGKGVAAVRTFCHEGREYLNTGGMYSANYRSCDAWSFCALADWRGPTYNYRTQCQAWDDGRTERGDRRGLVVTVRGQPAVLDGMVTFFDDTPGKSIVLLNKPPDHEMEEDGDEACL